MSQHKFEITIEEDISGKITVYAENEEQAEEIAKERYKNGEVQLDTLVCTQMMITYEDGTETNWSEFRI